MTAQEQVSAIIKPFFGKKNVVTNRINALQNAGFSVEYYGEQLNFGTSGRTKEIEGGVLVQMSYATAVKSQKTGWSYNRCKIYLVKK